MTSTFTDPDDFCRFCRGRGSWSERTDPYSARVAHVCDCCGGTGRRTMAVGRPTPEAVQRENDASTETARPLYERLGKMGGAA